MNKDLYRERFQNHVAKFTDYGNIKILDFKNPDSSEYRIRFLFEEDYYRLHISGDLGELIATNYNNMTFEKFGAFVRSIEYFKEKIDCHSRNIYTYNEDQARSDLEDLLTQYEVDETLGLAYYDDIDELIDDVLDDFSSEHGIGLRGYGILVEMIDDVREHIGEIGKRDTNILDIYMLAFEIAMEQLREMERK